MCWAFGYLRPPCGKSMTGFSKMNPPLTNRIPHVLVVEDDARTQKVLVFLLQRHGYTPTTVGDGQAAIDILNGANPPTIVLLDWEMPKLSGIDVCRLLRALPHDRYIYVIMVTARDSPADLVSAFEAGADDFLAKPVDAMQLLARMRCGERVLALEGGLAERIGELEHTLTQLSELTRLLPVCPSCQKVREEGAQTLCPECGEKARRETPAAIATPS